MRGTGEGHRPWDLAPNSTMTNANVEQAVTGVDGQTLTLKYKEGEKKVVVPSEAAIVTFVPGDRSDLKPGANIFVPAASAFFLARPPFSHARWRVGMFDYLPQIGKATVCMLLIETRAAVANIEAICKVDGVDCMIIAPFDLSTELGVPGRFDAPEFREAVSHLEGVILKADIPLGGAAFTQEQTRDLLKRGYRVLVHGFDVLMLAGLVRQNAEWRKN
jgi:hypothetical protein